MGLKELFPRRSRGAAFARIIRLSRASGCKLELTRRRIVSSMTAPVEPATELNITDIVRGPIPPRVVNTVWPNMLHTRIQNVVDKMGPPPWSVRLLQDERNLVTLIANP